MGIGEWFGFGDRFAAIGLPPTASAAEVAARCEALRIEAQKVFVAGDAAAAKRLAAIEATRAALRDDAACRRHAEAIAAGRRRRVRFGAYVLLPSLLVVPLAAWVRSLPPSIPSGPTQEEIDADAYRVCIQFVRNRLKAPGTAVFPSYERGAARQTLSVAAQRWEATGYVDAENGFGALIRSHWTCAVDSVGSQWQLVEIDIKSR